MVASTLDPQRILTILGLTGASRAERITGGWGGTVTWRIEQDGVVQALRVFPSGAMDAAARETAAMEAALAAGVPAPIVDRTGSSDGCPVMLTSWCPGQTGPEALRAAPWGVWSFGSDMGRVQARLHRVTAPDIVRDRTGDWISWAGEAEADLQGQLRALPPRDDALLHLDYHPRNILFDQGRVTGVIDWENVRAGDPRADVARTRTILWLAKYSPDVSRLSIPILQLLEAGWLRGYQREAGRLQDMALFEAWAYAALVADLSPKLGKPDVWLQTVHLSAIRRRLITLKREAGLSVAADTDDPDGG